MKTTSYQLNTSNKSGHIEVDFIDGILNGFKVVFKQPLTAKQFVAFLQVMPYNEKDINDFNRIGLTIEQQAEPERMPANKKIALFCEFYKRYKQGLDQDLRYRASKTDGNKIKEYKITEEILTAYFTSENFLFKGKQSISNLVKYYNELLAEMASKNVSKFPSAWSKEFENKLKGQDISDYWKHLKSLGLTPKKDRVGNTIEWVPANK